MATKDELSEEVNRLLGTNMEWERMKKKDLELLYDLAEDGKLAEPQVKQMAKKHGKKKVEEEIDEWRPGKYVSTLL